VTPFAEGAFGFAHITNNLTATLAGTDVSSQVLTTPFTSITNETDPIMFLGGGVSVAAGNRTAFDVGYNYSRIFITDQDINSGHIYGGLRVGF
jgi:opacity protein-like surface antigen